MKAKAKKYPKKINERKIRINKFGERMAYMGFSIPEKLSEKIMYEAERDKTSASRVVERAVERYFASGDDGK